jgi:hypothetical protein
MGNFSLKGVAVGGIVDVVSSGFAGVPLAIYAMVRSQATSLPEAQRTAALTTAMHAPGIHAAAMLIGALCSVLGGYVAATLAKRGEVMNGALSAWFCVAIGIYSVAWGSGSVSALQQVVTFVLSPLLGALGGYLRLRQLGAPSDGPLAPAAG